MLYPIRWGSGVSLPTKEYPLPNPRTCFGGDGWACYNHGSRCPHWDSLCRESDDDSNFTRKNSK